MAAELVAETGTTLVALAADGAAVLAADRRASVAGGRFVTARDVRKVHPVHPTAAAALSGAVGDLQAFVRALAAETDRYAAARGAPMGLDALATYAAGLLREGPFAAAPLLAGVDPRDADPAVYDLDPGGGAVETGYAAGGSGMQVAYGVLEAAHEPGLDEGAARRVAARAVAAAAGRDAASGDGLTVATVTADGVTTDVHDDAGEVAG